MQRLTSSSSSAFSTASQTRTLFGFVSLAALMALPLSIGCQGQLEGTFPAQVGNGTGGNSGSGGSGSGSGGATVAGCDAPTKVFQAKGCSSLGCHGGGPMDYPPNLAAADVASIVSTSKATIVCPDEKYADPANPQNSVLYKIIADRDNCQDQMPLGLPLEGTELTETLACLSDWVANIK